MTSIDSLIDGRNGGFTFLAKRASQSMVYGRKSSTRWMNCSQKKNLQRSLRVSQFKGFTWKNFSPLSSFASLSPAPSLFRGFFFSSCRRDQTRVWRLCCLELEENRSFKWFYLLDDGDGIGGKTRRILHMVVDDAVEHFLLILARERRLAGGKKDAELVGYTSDFYYWLH